MKICGVKEVGFGIGSKENFILENNSLSSKEVDTVLRVIYLG